MPKIRAYRFRYVYDFNPNGGQEEHEDYYDGYIIVDPDIITGNKSYHAAQMPKLGMHYYMYEREMYYGYPMDTPPVFKLAKGYVGFYTIPYHIPEEYPYNPWQVNK